MQAVALLGWGASLHGDAGQRLQFRGAEPLLPVGLTGWYEIEVLLRGGDRDLARAEVERLGKIVGGNNHHSFHIDPMSEGLQAGSLVLLLFQVMYLWDFFDD